MIEATLKSFAQLINIMDELREKCPWDKKQTIDTLRTLTIEETYELADAITEKDWAGIKEELGDLMLHLVFYAKIGTEKSAFTLQEVIDGVCEKLIERHPHIYGDVQVSGEDEVKLNWEKIKLNSGKTSVLSGVPKSLPALVKAIRLQEKSRQVGFEWENKSQVWQKVEEEISELKEAEEKGDPALIAEEMGDVLFSMVNYARFLSVDAENALELTNKKFIHRFNEMERMIKEDGKILHNLSLLELDGYWNQVKQNR
jgi:MazG family protein